MNRHHRLSLLLLGALVLGAAACGSGPDGGPATPTGSAPSDPGIMSSEEPDAEEQPQENEPDEPQGEDAPEETDDGAELVPVASPEDCISYDPNDLNISGSGTSWYVRDGDRNMAQFTSFAEAEDARRVFYAWKQRCFIGRNNDRADRDRYIITYFAIPSGLPLGPAPVNLDCVTYDPDTLHVVSGPAAGEAGKQDFSLLSGGTPLLVLASPENAQRALIVADGFSRLCAIGDGSRTMEWWRK